MIKGVLFDRDGVIADTEIIHINSVVKTFKEMGIAISKEEEKSLIGKHPKDYVKIFRKKYEFSEGFFLKKQFENYKTLFRSPKLYLETVKVIKELKKMGYRIGLVTSSDRPTTNIVIKSAKLQGVFDAIVTEEECKKRKPDPFPYLLGIQKLGLKRNECLIVEDSQTGIQAAKNAKIKSIVLLNEYSKNRDFILADYKLDSPGQIIEILEELNQ